MRERPQVDSRLARDVDVAVDADVGDRVALADEELAPAQVVVEQAQHLLAAALAANGFVIGRREPAGQEPEAEAPIVGITSVCS